MMAFSEANPDRPRNDASDGAASLESVRACLAERLRAARPEIEEALFAHLDMGFDPAGGEDAEYVAGAHATVAEVVDYCLVGIEQGEQWLGSVPPAAAAQARRAARNGVTLQTMLLRYTAGHTLFEDYVMREAERGELSGESLALRHVLRTLGGLLDHLTSSVANEYQYELQRAARSPELCRTERVQKLLAGGHPDAAELGYEFDAHHLGVIAMGSRAKETVRALAAGLGRRLLSVSRSEETVWAWFGGERRLAISDIEGLLSTRKPAGVSLAIGEPGRGIYGWRLTHRQAQAAMLVALRRPQMLTRYADVALLAAVLRDKELAGSLLEIYLSPLHSEKDGAARRTLRAYCAAGHNAATAAAALGVDRHTVKRHLHAIEERLGRPLDTCRPELEVALRLEELGDGVAAPRVSHPPLH